MPSMPLINTCNSSRASWSWVAVFFVPNDSPFSTIESSRSILHEASWQFCRMSSDKYRISLMRSASVAMRTSNRTTGLGNKLIANPDTSSFVRQSPDHLEAVEAPCGHYGSREMAMLRVNSSKRYPEGYEAIERELEDM